MRRRKSKWRDLVRVVEKPFDHPNFKKKEPVLKALTVGLETIIFSYGHPKDVAAFIKLNKALSRYSGIEFKV